MSFKYKVLLIIALTTIAFAGGYKSGVEYKEKFIRLGLEKDCVCLGYTTEVLEK